MRLNPHNVYFLPFLCSESKARFLLAFLPDPEIVQIMHFSIEKEKRRLHWSPDDLDSLERLEVDPKPFVVASDHLYFLGESHLHSQLSAKLIQSKKGQNRISNNFGTLLAIHKPSYHPKSGS